MFYSPIFRRAATVLSLAFLFLPGSAHSRVPGKARPDERLSLSSQEKREQSVLQAKEQILAHLRGENTCSAWFRETDPDSAEVFDSLHFLFVEDGPIYVLRGKDAHGNEQYKHPWAARTQEFAGRNSSVYINPDGPFFRPSSQVIEIGSGGGFQRYA